MSGAPLTPDQENFWRLIHILWDDVSRMLRVFFKSKYHQLFHIAWGDNQLSGEFFIANSSTARTGQHIIDTIRQGNTANYDCAALFKCLLYSETEILLPKLRRGTRTPPIRDSERVDELREMRNELAHSTSASVPSATFNMKLSSLEDVYAQLHWDPTEMRRLARDPVATAECTRLEQLLDAERLRYSGLDLTVQALDGTVQALDGTVQALDGTVQVLDQHQQSQADQGQANTDQLRQQVIQLEDHEQQLEDHEQQLEDHKQQLEDHEQQLEDHEQQLEDHEQQLQDHEQHLEDQKQQLEDHEQQLQDHEQKLQDHEQQLQEVRTAQDMMTVQRPVQDATVKEKLKKALRKMYSDLTVPVQDRVDSNSCSNVPLDEMFVELRLQKFDKINLPETLGNQDVEEIQQSMQSAEPIQISQLFEKLHDRCAPGKVLILGKAGIGKTTLIKQIAKQWAEKELWNDVIEYLFVITLRQLQQNRKWTLGNLLLEGLQLTEEEKTAALEHLRENPSNVMIVEEGLDECNYLDEEVLERDDTKETELNSILSSVLNNGMLPGAKVIITSRPNDNIPSAACDRTVELYGFPQESIKKYIHEFSREEPELEPFIQQYLQNNVNLETLCYVPLLCNIICVCLSDMLLTDSEDERSVNTMTQLYIYAVVNLAKKLHPSLKGIRTQINSKKIFDEVGSSLKNHADLAKYCTMSTPQRIIIYEDDLDQFDISDKDKHTGFLAESVMKDCIPNLNRPCWWFSHLTIQEMFAAVGLLRGKREALLELITDKTSVCQHEMLITFISGLLCDQRNADFMKHLESAEDQLDPPTFIEKLAVVFDPLQLTTIIHEGQSPDLVDLVPEEIKSYNVSPTEIMSLGWVLMQPECCIISLILSYSSLDVHLVRQLCNGLTHNKSVQKLDLDHCKLTDEGVKALVDTLKHLPQLTYLRLDSNKFGDSTIAQTLAANVSKMTALQTLSLNRCQLSGAGTKALADALHHLPGLIDLRLDSNRFDDQATVHVLANNVLKMTALQILSLNGCKLSGAGAYTLAAALQHLPLLTKLKLDSNKFDDPSTGQALVDAISKMTKLETLGLNGCKLSGARAEALAVALGQLPQLKKARLDSNQFGDPSTGKALVDAISKMTALEELSLNGCKLSGTGTDTLAITLRHLPGLIQLSLDGIQFIDPTTGQALADSLSKMTALRQLSLNGCKLSGAGAEALATALHQLPQLTKLRLDSNRFDKPTTIGSLAASVSKMTALQQLSLNGCQLSGPGANPLADALHHLPQLTELSFENNNLSDPSTGETFTDSVSKMMALHTLSLNGCQLSGAGANALVNALRHLPQLTRLRLDSNQFGDPTMGQTLADNVSKMTALKTLSLSGCQLSGAGTKALVVALHQLSQLTELSFNYNNLSDETTGQTFVDSVSQMTDLRALSLNGCKLSGETTRALAVALGHMPQLTKLSLNGNNCSDPTTGEALVDNVSKMTGLQLLSLQYCSIQAEALTTLLDNLCHLTSLKELNLSHIGTVAAQQLCRSLSQLSQLEKLRLEKCHINRTSEHAIKRVANSLPRLKFFRLY